jgi:hypothetical protein
MFTELDISEKNIPIKETFLKKQTYKKQNMLIFLYNKKKL